jgi:hypothetical protein
VDLHVGGVLCAVHGYLYAVLGCAVIGGVEPPALPVTLPRKVAGTADRGCARLHKPATRYTSFSGRLFEEVGLPVGALDPYVEFADLPGEGVGLRAEFGDGQGCDHGQFGAQLTYGHASLVLAGSRVRRSGNHGMTGPEYVTAGEGVGQRTLVADRYGGVGVVDPADQRFQFVEYRAGFGQ